MFSSTGGGEQFPRPKLDGVQGFLFVVQGDKMYLENGGENFLRLEHGSSMQ